MFAHSRSSFPFFLQTVALAAFTFPSIALADATEADAVPTRLEEIIVTANPLGRSADDLVQPVDVIAGEALDRKRKSTIGETLEGEPGISSADFGPGVGRPVIRGQGGARVLMLENGIASMDVSTVSADHAVSIDPNHAEQVEIIKGPATLIYGSAAAAGVVNVVNQRLREKLDPGLHGNVDASYADNGDERIGRMGLSYGFSDFVVGGDFAQRKTGDFEIPGFSERDAESEEHEDHEAPVRGELGNSAVDTRSGSLYAAWVRPERVFSFAYSRYNSDYGIPAGHAHEDEELPGDEAPAHEEGGVVIGLEQERFDAQGLWFKPFAGFDKARLRVGANDYTHTEFEAPGEPGTVFGNREIDSRFELTHQHVGDVRGVVGLQWNQREFSAIGDEAFVPPVDSRNVGIFVVEEMSLGDHRLEAGARIEHSDNQPGFGGSETHTPVSLSVGAVFAFDDRHHLRLSAARSQRAPVAEELFAYGPHLATQTFERGHRDLDVETANNVEIGIDRHDDRLTWSIALYYNRISDYVYLGESTARLNADGSAADPAQVSGFEDGAPDRVDEGGLLAAEGELLLLDYHQADADFIGAEAELAYELLTGPFTLQGRLFGDLVRGELRTGGDLPRITPPRYGLGLEGRYQALSYGLTLTRVQAQDRVSALETTTDGYDLLSADLGYSLAVGPTTLTLYLRGRNLLDEEARRHVSFLKDLAPLPGRSIITGLTLRF